MSVSSLDYGSCTVHQYENGPADNYLYLLQDKATNKAAVVDPAWDVAFILAELDALGVELDRILITHSHADHVNGVNELLGARPVPLHVSSAEADFWSSAPDDAIKQDNGDKLMLGETEITWLVTPGHTPGSSCFQLDGALVAADTLFMFGCGRCDMKGGDPSAMFRTLQTLKTTIADDTVIYPGHNYGDRPHSTMAVQKSGNPFLHYDQEADFIRYRMELHDATRDSPYQPMTPAELPA